MLACPVATRLEPTRRRYTGPLLKSKGKGIAAVPILDGDGRKGHYGEAGDRGISAGDGGMGVSQFATYSSLRDRVVFITGGASGIGESLVEHFCAQGAKVAFVDIEAAAGEALARSIAARGAPEPLPIHCDLRDIAALRAAVARTVAELGPIGVLVNNAANDTRHPVDDVTVEYWDDRMAVNLRHKFFAAQAVRPHMTAAGGGSIVNISSVSFLKAQGGMPAYLTAKSGVIGLTRALARDYGADGIRVNTVIPGWIMTQRQIDLWLDEESEQALLREQCLKEKVFPPDVARLVLFLAADDSRMCSAQAFTVDGGWT